MQSVSQSALLKTIIKKLAGALLSVPSEIYEVLFVDSLIERNIQDLGGTDTISIILERNNLKQVKIKADKKYK
ncbi:hypothetical protein LCGC14_2074800 [marine sediment metagenome]|uniref:Uncharacterized protein n=1 Tax=marine sediment metagenome TaxID=412755 RepID=A0A0F9F4P6_9ZZZZ